MRCEYVCVNGIFTYEWKAFYDGLWWCRLAVCFQRSRNCNNSEDDFETMGTQLSG
jgi:hypothetical protein